MTLSLIGIHTISYIDNLYSYQIDSTFAPPIFVILSPLPQRNACIKNQWHEI